MCMCNFACKGLPQNDLYCVGQDVKPYSLIHSITAESFQQPTCLEYYQLQGRTDIKTLAGRWRGSRLLAIAVSVTWPLDLPFPNTLPLNQTWSGSNAWWLRYIHLKMLNSGQCGRTACWQKLRP